MEKLKKLLKSRTLWLAVMSFILGGIQSIADLIPSNLFILIQSLLLAGIAYFKANPSQKYGE